MGGGAGFATHFAERAEGVMWCPRVRGLWATGNDANPIRGNISSSGEQLQSRHRHVSPGVCGCVWVGGVLIGGARLVDGCEVRIAGLVSCFTYNNTRSAVQRVGPRWSLARVCKNGLLWNWFRLTDLRPPFARYLCYARRGARSRPAARRPASEARWTGEGGCRRRRQEPSSVTSTSANSSPSSCQLTRTCSFTNSPPSPYYLQGNAAPSTASTARRTSTRAPPRRGPGARGGATTKLPSGASIVRSSVANRTSLRPGGGEVSRSTRTTRTTTPGHPRPLQMRLCATFRIASTRRSDL